MPAPVGPDGSAMLMGRINLDDAQPGMVLDVDVTADEGRLLLAAGGTVLGEFHLRIFRMWGVAEIGVEGVTRQDAEARAREGFDAEALAAAAARVDARFRHLDRAHPLVAALARLSLERLARAVPPGGRRDA